MKISYRKAEISDAELLVEIYNAAFYDDYMKYGECPGYGKSKQQMETSIEKMPKYVIMVDSVPAGVLSYKKQETGVYYIGGLCIIPEYQRQGIGTDAMQFFFDKFSDWKKVTLKAVADKEAVIRFYIEKCGFRIGDMQKDGKVQIVNLIRER